MPHQIGHTWKTTTATPFLLIIPTDSHLQLLRSGGAGLPGKRQAMKTENVAYKTPGAWCCVEQDLKNYRAKGTDEYKKPWLENN